MQRLTVAASVLGILLLAGSYSLGRMGAVSSPSCAPQEAALSVLEKRLTGRIDELGRAISRLRLLQTAAVAHAGAMPPQLPLPGRNGATSDVIEDEAEPAPTTESVIAFDAAQKLVSDAVVSQAAWDDEKRDEFHQKLDLLNESQAGTVLSQLAMAINAGELTVTAMPPL